MTASANRRAPPTMRWASPPPWRPRARFAPGARDERDLILLFTDSEELGLNGAKTFFGTHPLVAHVGVIVNMEARGAAGRVNMFETGNGNGAFMKLYADTVARPATNSLSVLIYDLMPNSTDYTVAKKLGIPGYNLAGIGGAFTYHSPMSTPAAVDRGSVQDMGDQALALTSALIFADTLPAKTGNAAFADLMGYVTIVYPAVAGWAILLVAGALIGLALWRTKPAARSIGGGMVVVAAVLFRGALLLTVLNALSGSGNVNYYDRLAALPRLELIAVLGLTVLLTLLPLFRRQEMRLLAIAPAMALMWAGLLAGGPLVMIVVVALLAMLAAWFLPLSPTDSGVGAILLVLVAATLGQIAQPTAGPLLQWPLLLAAVALAARATLPAKAGLAVSALCAVIGLGHLFAQGHYVFLGVGAEMPVALIVLLFAALPLLLPLMPDRMPRWLPAAALAAALVLALWVRLDPIAPSVPEYSKVEAAKKTRD